MNSANPIRIVLAKAAAFFLAVLLTTGTALAIDQPPQEPEQQRAWLVGHLVTDMEALGAFNEGDLAKVPGIVSSLTDDQVALLCQFYFLTRSKTEQDAYLYALQQQGNTEEQVAEAKVPIADILATMNDQAVACYAQLLPMPQPVQYLAQICYASVPGWCCHARCFVPEWYYDNGCYVGPCHNAAYAGSWAVPVCRAYYDHGSLFYTNYHRVANAVYVNRSTHLAQRHADWFRHQGDWKGVLAHGRFVHGSPGGYHGTATRFAQGTQNHVGNRTLAARAPAGSGQHQIIGDHQQAVRKVNLNYASAGQTPKVHHQAAFKPQATHSPPAYSATVHQQASKPQASRAPATHAPKARHQTSKAQASGAPAARPARAHAPAAKPRASHASAPRSPKPRQQAPKAHASRSSAPHAQHTASHASHSKPASHAQAHAGSGGHSGQKKHR